MKGKTTHKASLLYARKKKNPSTYIDQTILLLKQRDKTHITHCPITNLTFDEDQRRVKDAGKGKGCCVALGRDKAATDGWCWCKE
jgi:cytosine/adenosine deaminase-related metal-dependent hydrolase